MKVEQDIKELIENSAHMSEYQEALQTFEKAMRTKLPNIEKLRNFHQYFWTMGYITGVRHAEHEEPNPND